MRTLLATDDVAPLRGRWLRLHYSQSFRGQPVRPLLRFALADGACEEHILPAAGFGRARWIGWAPHDLARLELVADLDDAADFRLDAMRPCRTAPLLWRGVRRHPSGLVDLALWPGKDRRAQRLSLQRLLDLEPLERIAAFAAERTRPLEPDGLDAGLLGAGGEVVLDLVVAPEPARPDLLRDTLASLAASRDVPGWRVRVAGGADARPGPTPPPHSGFSLREPRNDGEAPERRALALALESDAAFVALLRPGDRLRPEALPILIDALVRHPEARLLYADSAIADASGRLIAPELKPDWSPEFLAHADYVGRPALLRTDLLRTVAGEIGPDDPHPWRRAVELAGAAGEAHGVHHVRRVLLHRADAAAIPSPLRAKARDEPPRPASIVIPTRNRVELLRRAVESVRDLTPSGSYELVVVDNGSDEPDTLAYLGKLRACADVVLLHEPGPFNFSRLVNRGVAASRHPVVVLLNNDCEVLHPGWLGRLAALAGEPGIGAVGARLLYADGTLQHAGIGIGLGGFAGHRDRGEPCGHPGHLGRLRAPHEVAAVTAACLAVARETYLAAGGFDESFAVAFNDVDFCLRLASMGLRTILAADVEMRHAESASRGRDAGAAKRGRFLEEAARFAERWRDWIQADPYTHPLFATDRFADRLG